MPEILNGSDPIEVSTEDLRLNLSNYLGQVRFADRVVVVKKHNHETAIIISPRMLQRLLDSSKATRADRQAAFKKLEAMFADISAGDPETLDQDINQAIAEHRAEKRKKNKQ